MLQLNNHSRSTIDRTMDKLRRSCFQIIGDLSLTAWVTKEPVSFENRYEGEKKDLKIGDSWGQLWDCGWFHVTGEVPEEGKDKKIVLLIDVNGEGNIYDKDLCPVRGLTNVCSTFERSLGEPAKRVYHYLDCSKGNEAIDLWMETGCNDLFGSYSKKGTIEQAHIAICHDEMRQLYYDFEVLRSLLGVLDEKSARYHAVFRALCKAAYAINELSDDNISKAREILAVQLAKKGGDPSLTVSAIGHAHIDLAWLWPIRETKRKGARTFSTVMDLMDKYPDYVFGASQPQLFQWMKEGYPKLYAKMQEKIHEGRFEVQGGMWVESDTNVPSGESLVRQFLYGKQFFREEFNKDMKVLWLPDVFGYSGALPQILKKAGVDYFMTIKLSWSEVNHFPHHTFNWEGIDGTKVLAHMPPEGTYNSSASPKAIKNAENHFRDKGVSDECLVLYGIGDGGGGPGAEHLERLKRMKDLNGIAPVKQEPAIDFFERINENQEEYEVWKGELYLEKHQGTYTSQSKSKWYNRKMEFALKELEFLSVLAKQETGRTYEQSEIEAIWKEVLLYQFHDILPGSSINRVYDESLARYAMLMDQVKTMSADCVKVLAGQMNTKDSKNPYLVVNSSSYEREEWIEIENKYHQVTVPAMGYTIVDGENEGCHETMVKGDTSSVENDVLKVEFDEKGAICRIYDKENHMEVIEGIANELTLYDDYGNAWDINMDYKNQVNQVLVPTDFIVEVNEVQVKAIQSYAFGESTMRQEIVLTAGSRRVDFVSHVSWQESDKMLRVAFPTTVHTNQVKCDIQFGNIDRSNHNNTTWDAAKFEICAQKWVDLANTSYGVALMNDSKYGHYVDGSTLDLDLLRSTNYPGKSLDKGEHEFTYSLYPHKGDAYVGEVNREAYALNIPLNITKVGSGEGALAPEKTFLSMDNDQIVIESVKKAEKDGGIIVRMYEANGGKVKTDLICGFDAREAYEVNLMEEKIGDQLEMTDGKIALAFKPFEIKTIYLN